MKNIISLNMSRYIVLYKNHFYLLIVFLIVASSLNSEPSRYWVDDFESYEVGIMPSGWKGRSGKAKKYYKIAEESLKGKKNKYLKVDNFQTAQFIGKISKVDIVKYPFLYWKWRVRVLPPKGDESTKKYCDVPASMNVVLDNGRILGLIPRPKTIKYSWSTTLKKGTITKSPFARWPSRCDIIVLRSGASLKGRWVQEKRNVLEDYKKFYKRKKVDSKIIDLITIMSDADSTKTTSAADYDDIYFSTH